MPPLEVLVAALLPGFVVGQPAEPSGGAPLAGPKVGAPAAAATLVERDFDGKVKRLEIPPPEAAVKLLELDEATRAAVDEVLLKRAAVLDGIVRDNLLLIVQIAGAGQAGDREEARRLLLELKEKAAPLRERGQLAGELAAVLPPEQARKVRALVQEYWGAIVTEKRAEEGTAAGGEKMGEGEGEAKGGVGRVRAEGGATAAEALAAVGREIRRSYDRVVTSAVKDFEELIKRLELSPEQEAEVRRLAQDSFQQTAGKATPAQRGELFVKIYGVLEPGQRAKLVGVVRERRGG